MMTMSKVYVRTNFQLSKTAEEIYRIGAITRGSVLPMS